MVANLAGFSQLPPLAFVGTVWDLKVGSSFVRYCHLLVVMDRTSSWEENGEDERREDEGDCSLNVWGTPTCGTTSDRAQI